MAQNGTIAPNLEKYAIQAAKNENLINYKINWKNSSERGDGYIGLVDFVQVKGTNKNGEEKVLDLVVKTAPASEKLRIEVPIRMAFLVENYHYSKVHPKFCELQEDHKITDPFVSFAKCYATFNDDFEEGLVMQNLKAIGYDLWDRKVPMNEGHVAFVMKEYGRFHALTFALRETDPEGFQQIAKGLDNRCIYDFMENSQKMLTGLWDNVMKNFDVKTDSRVVKKMEEFRLKLISFLYEETTKVDDCSVVLHGDCWTNNMMFKYEDNKNRKTPSGMVFLDWQISRVSSPVLDLSYFFYACSSLDIIKDLDRYQKIYHDSFSTHLQKFGCNPNALFPFSKLQEHWKLYGKYGLILSTMVIRIMLSEKEEAPNMTEAAESGQNVLDAFQYESSREDEYLERVKGIVRHFVERDML